MDDLRGKPGARVLASVVIPVFNDRAGLVETLIALEQQSLPKDEFEVLVVDDGSTDGTADVVQRSQNVRVIRRAESGGSYVARNEGIAAAVGQMIALTDADCLPDPDWLRNGLSLLSSDPSAVLAGRIRMPLGNRPSLAAMVDVIHHLDQERSVSREGYAVTANLIALASTFETVGPFDELLRSSGDRDWTTRARQAGFKLSYASDVTVVHPPRTTARALIKKSRRVGKGASTLRRINGSAGSPMYVTRGWFVPRDRELGLKRVRDNGADPGRLRWLAVGGAQLAYLQWPQLLAALAEDVRHGVAPRRRPK